jgi:hypothetical protein
VSSVQLLAAIPDWEWPADAAEVLLEALRGGAAGEEELELAAELAGSVCVMDDEIARTLLDLVLDPGVPPSVRGAAAIALGPTLEDMDTFDADDPIDEREEPLVSPPVLAAIRETLHRTYLNAEAPNEVRRRALEASVRSRESWHDGVIRAAFYSDDNDWKRTAVFCMRYVPGFDREIVEALEHAHPLIRLHAVRAAGAHEVEDAWPHVRAILDGGTEDRELLLAAIEAAGSIESEEAEELFRRLDDSDEEVAAAIEEALSMGRASRAVDDSFEGDGQDDED